MLLRIRVLCSHLKPGTWSRERGLVPIISVEGKKHYAVNIVQAIASLVSSYGIGLVGFGWCAYQQLKDPATISYDLMFSSLWICALLEVAALSALPTEASVEDGPVTRISSAVSASTRSILFMVAHLSVTRLSIDLPVKNQIVAMNEFDAATITKNISNHI